MTVRILWEPRDLWIGVYWDRRCLNPEHNGVDCSGAKRLVLYICIIPCLLVVLTFGRPA